MKFRNSDVDQQTPLASKGEANASKVISLTQLEEVKAALAPDGGGIDGILAAARDR